ncbi:MAG: methyltransferase domain-containing protein [Candidatus Paceibacterota bacterium]|jgi:ubiquinone/menaquinone biosynthesis C-methylase UbiE
MTHQEDKMNLTLEALHATNEERGQFLIKKYQGLYGLPTIETRETVDYKFFLQAKRGINFVVIAAYDHARDFLTIRNFSRGAGWELLGGFIHDAIQEQPEHAALRIVLGESGLAVSEMTPIAMVKNIFVYGEESVTHYGIAFMAECRGTPSLIHDFRGEFSANIPSHMLASDKSILKLAHHEVHKKKGGTPLQEIDSVNKFHILIWFHEWVVSPLMHYLSSSIIDAFLFKAIGCPTTFLDVAVGDDDFIIHLAKKCRKGFFVANDISFRTTEFLRKQVNDDEFIVFTNHNATHLPFVEKFDVTLCKNTMHHMNSKEEMFLLLESLKNVSRKLVIVDIENPRQSTKAAYVWNWYYRKILGDQGGFFLSQEQFHNIIKGFFSHERVKFGVIYTVKGRYLTAIVDSKE